MTSTTDTGHDPLAQWKGQFGHEYMRRNEVDSDTINEATIVFQRILNTSQIRRLDSILEVGANLGINLHGLRRVLGDGSAMAALEPNPTACAQLRQDPHLHLANVIEADAYRIPVPDRSYDLVFTNGVLIHIPPTRLHGAISEIVRVSRRYILCSEYFSHSPTELPYRGNTGLLWKQDFGAAYLDNFPVLRTRAYGFLWQREFPHFDDLNWWMFEKIPDLEQ